MVCARRAAVTSRYSQGDIALGLSRIFTTYGGDIFAWSAAGDINAGRGAKTTLVYTPPRRVYDDIGNATCRRWRHRRRRHRHPGADSRGAAR